MQLTYLGHAGFCIETHSAIIVMDPWLSAGGAFDAAWFQYPKNHHLAEAIQTLFSESKKEKFIYISHEHRDHFDIAFLESLKNRDFTLLLANFAHPTVKLELEQRHYQCKKIMMLNDNEPFSFGDGTLVLFILDTELNCDSAILVQTAAGRFLNLNDCKIHDRLQSIVEEYGDIDVFTAQFSGASWYPTCYQMTAKQYQTACHKKNTNKFEAIANALAVVKPKLYLPSAGPPCFLDPLLLSFNFQTINTYPQASQLFTYLDQHRASLPESTHWVELLPGSELEIPSLKIRHKTATQLTNNFKSTVLAYANEYQEFFRQREIANQRIQPQTVFTQLKAALEQKLAAIQDTHEPVKTLLYWRLNELPKQMYCLDLDQKTIETTSSIKDKTHYVRITAPAWLVNKVLTHEINWPDFALTFRMTVERVPDVYNTLMHGFLILDADKIPSFCEKLANFNAKNARFIIEFEGKRYSVSRYCPHQGGDLAQGHLNGSCWVCPIHQWQFDLKKNGHCTHNESCIQMICLSDVKTRP